jgi:flagellar basal-body rod protein FlgG
MATQQHQQEVIANNLANIDTVGFKRDLAVFQQRLQEGKVSPGGNQFIPSSLKNSSGGLFVAEDHTDFSPGTLEYTDRNLDVAITGSGFFAVQDGSKTFYSRDGRLGLSNEKLVRLSDNKSVLDESGKEISLSDVSSSDLRIDSEGNIWNKSQLVSKLKLVEFDDPQRLTKKGGNLFDAQEQEGKETNSTLISGTLEASTVNPSKELTQMIQTSRFFQMNAEMLSMQDQSLGRLLAEIPKL